MCFPNLGWLDQCFTKSFKREGYDKAKDYLVKYLTNSEETKKEFDDNKELFDWEYAHDFLINLAKYILRQSYSTEKSPEVATFVEFRDMLFSSDNDSRLKASSPIGRFYALLEDKKVVDKLVTAYLGQLFTTNKKGELGEKHISKGEVKPNDPKIIEILEHIRHTGRERRLENHRDKIFNFRVKTKLRLHAHLIEREYMTGKDMFAAFHNDVDERTGEVGTLALNYPGSNNLKLLAVVESSEKDSGVNIILDRIRDWFTRIDVCLLNSDVERPHFISFLINRLNYEVMTSSDMTPMKLSLAIISSYNTCLYSLGGQSTYYIGQSAGFGKIKKDYPRLGDINNGYYLLHDLPMTDNLRGYKSIILATDEADKCLNENGFLQKDTTLYDIKRKIKSSKLTKPMSLAVYQKSDNSR